MTFLSTRQLSSLLRHGHRVSVRMASSTNAPFSSPFITDKAFIDGKWVKASKNTFEVTNPDTGEVIGKAPNCTDKDANVAIQAAARAFTSWSTTPAKYRAELLRKLFTTQMSYQKELAELISFEMGKPLNEAMGEIVYGASFFDWFSEQARRINGEILQSQVPNEKFLMYTKEPVGPAAIICPWNFPNAMITRKLGAALAAGCTAGIS